MMRVPFNPIEYARDLRRRAAELRHLADLIEKAERIAPSDGATEDGANAPTKVRRIRRVKVTGRPKRVGRRAELVEYLRAHGPAKRGTILRETTIPIGTLASLLADRETFQKGDDMRWFVKKEA